MDHSCGRLHGRHSDYARPDQSMHCSSCVIRIELALQLTPGVVSARANLGPNAVDIEYQPEKTDFALICSAIESAGYRVAEPKIEPTSETLDPAGPQTVEMTSATATAPMIQTGGRSRPGRPGTALSRTAPGC